MLNTSTMTNEKFNKYLKPNWNQQSTITRVWKESVVFQLNKHSVLVKSIQ
jgi:hypothetical protein